MCSDMLERRVGTGVARGCPESETHLICKTSICFIKSIGKNIMILKDERKLRLIRNRVEETKKNCCCFCSILYLNAPNRITGCDEDSHLKGF